MDSLTRGALINAVPTPFTSTRKNLSLPSSHFTSIPQFKTRVSVSSSFNPDGGKNRVVEKIQNCSKALVFTVAAALMIGRFSQFTARAETPVEVVQEKEEEKEEEESPLSDFLESHSEALKSLLQKKLEDGEDGEALKILKRLVSAQPLELEWKFLMARLYDEIGQRGEARRVYQEILEKDPLCFDALFQNAVLMDQSGEGQAAIQMLQEKLSLAQEEQKDKEARNVRLILAQIQYLQKNVDEALRSYEELAEEDPADYRPYFYQFVIYSLLDRNDEAKAQFAKCCEVCPKDFKVEGFLQTPLSRIKLFGSGVDD